jgi:hypothetical protein
MMQRHTLRRDTSLLAACAVLTVLLTSATLTRAAPPTDSTIASKGKARITAQSSIDGTDPYAALRGDPYRSTDNADPRWAELYAAPDDPATLNVLGRPAQRIDSATSMARIFDNSIDPEELVPSSYAQVFGDSPERPVINTLDPVALSAAVVDVRSSGAGALSKYGPSPFVAGQCLYLTQDIPIQGLPTACR